jgi:hypothetical protein
MAAAGFINVQGLGSEKLQATIRSLEPSVVRPAMRTGLREGFKITHRAVLAATPVRTGRMKQAIKLRAANQLRGDLAMRIFLPRRAELGVPWIKRLGARGGKAPGYYPAAIEFGWNPTYRGSATTTVRESRRTSRQGLYKTYVYQRKSRATGMRTRIAPRSFMRGPFHATAEQVKTRVRREAWVQIRERLRARAGGAA